MILATVLFLHCLELFAGKITHVLYITCHMSAYQFQNKQ